MDRSFLSDEQVMAAARDFVCIRLSTYENAVEAERLKSIFTPPSGELENTTFALLAPDGKTVLGRAGRSPRFIDGEASSLAQRMSRVASRYRESAKPLTVMPLESDLRLALNVSRCDDIPLVCLVGQGEESSLAELSLDSRWRGRFVWVRARQKEAASLIGKDVPENGLVVLSADTFGTKATLLSQAASRETKAVVAALGRGLEGYDPKGARDVRRHVRSGRQAGINWKTAIPVTDPHAKEGGGRPPHPPERRSRPGRRGDRGREL